MSATSQKRVLIADHQRPPARRETETNVLTGHGGVCRFFVFRGRDATETRIQLDRADFESD